jgi:hypothetical protein
MCIALKPSKASGSVLKVRLILRILKRNRPSVIPYSIIIKAIPDRYIPIPGIKSNGYSFKNKWKHKVAIFWRSNVIAKRIFGI